MRHHIWENRRKRQGKEVISLLCFKNGVSLIPKPDLRLLAKVAELQGLEESKLMFRDWTDIISEKVWQEPKAVNTVMRTYPHIFLEFTEIEVN